MIIKKILFPVGIVSFLIIVLSIACTKNTNPQPPVHDTVTVSTTDTLYATKPDSTVNLTKGLLLYLPFSGNIADSSGNNNTTYAIGSVLTYDAHGYSNSAFGSTGAGERVIVENNGSIKYDTAWSLSFGFSINTVQTSTYLSFIDTIDGKGGSFNLGTSHSGTPSFVLGSEDISLGCSAIGTNDNINIADTTGFVPLPNAWYNVVSIYHRGAVQFYVNGKLVSSKTGMGTKANLCPDAQIVIGGWWNSDPQSYNGKLDNIRLYNRVLTPHEIVALSSSYQITSNRQRPSLQTH